MARPVTTITPELNRAVIASLLTERRGTVDRLWRRIEKATSAPEHLSEPVGLTWLQLIRIFDEERVAP